jgi:hypothetical protein
VTKGHPPPTHLPAAVLWPAALPIPRSRPQPVGWGERSEPQLPSAMLGIGPSALTPTYKSRAGGAYPATLGRSANDACKAASSNGTSVILPAK